MNLKPMKSFVVHIIFVALLVAIDQITKQMALQFLVDTQTIKVLGFLKFVLVYNEGAAFGIFNQAGGWQFYLLTILPSLVSIIILVWIWQVCVYNHQLSFALALILAGAIGNLIDRFIYQFVIDFILLHYQEFQFPVFNFADSVITIGAVLLILDSIGWRFIAVTQEKRIEPENS